MTCRPPKPTRERGGELKVMCAATHGGHVCSYEHDDIDHFPKDWDGPWLLGVTHRCGCKEPVTWPEVA